MSNNINWQEFDSLIKKGQSERERCLAWLKLCNEPVLYLRYFENSLAGGYTEAHTTRGTETYRVYRKVFYSVDDCKEYFCEVRDKWGTHPYQESNYTNKLDNIASYVAHTFQW